MTDEKTQAARPKILLVEDNFMNKVLVKEVLTLRGFDVVDANNGLEALKALSSMTPDVILMDLHLPEMDGITAMRIIKKDARYGAIPVLALTASAMKGEEEKILNKGFDGYIAKPVDIKNLAATVEGYLKKTGEERE
ncbi:MAG: response regulator [Deltaproteobacteria bacterium]|nr:response regulator [Deltaproteobacteria bacterium]